MRYTFEDRRMAVTLQVVEGIKLVQVSDVDKTMLAGATTAEVMATWRVLVPQHPYRTTGAFDPDGKNSQIAI